MFHVYPENTRELRLGSLHRQQCVNVKKKLTKVALKADLTLASKLSLEEKGHICSGDRDRETRVHVYTRRTFKVGMCYIYIGARGDAKYYHRFSWPGAGISIGIRACARAQAAC